MLHHPPSLSASFSDFPSRSLSEIRGARKKFTVPWSNTTIKKMVILAKSDEVLASSKGTRNRMHCHDLWDKRMQMDAVKVLMAKNDPRVRRHKLEQCRTLSQLSHSNPISHRTRTWMQSKPTSPKLGVTWDTLPTLCTTQLSQSITLKSRLDRAKRAIVRHKATKSVGEEVGLSEFIRDEVMLYRAGAMNSSILLNKSGVLRLSHKKKALGIQFYQAQRRKGMFEQV